MLEPNYPILRHQFMYYFSLGQDNKDDAYFIFLLALPSISLYIMSTYLHLYVHDFREQLENLPVFVCDMVNTLHE